MKYGKLIDFHPIEDVIQLKSADDVATGRGYVESYVVSDTMADNLVNAMINQLQLDEVVDNKGVLVVGNYGTGKSHLMSVVSAIASDKENLLLLKNKKLAASMESIAGRFEILRIEIGGVRVCQEFCVNHFSVCRIIVFHEFRHTLIHQQLVANERPVWYPAP